MESGDIKEWAEELIWKIDSILNEEARRHRLDTAQAANLLRETAMFLDECIINPI